MGRTTDLADRVAVLENALNAMSGKWDTFLDRLEKEALSKVHSISSSSPQGSSNKVGGK